MKSYLRKSRASGSTRRKVEQIINHGFEWRRPRGGTCVERMQEEQLTKGAGNETR